MNIPRRLEWIRGEPGGGAWLEALPQIATELAEQWALRLGEPYERSNVSLAVPADGVDATPAVLKINFPGPENEREADALAHYDGRGAVRLLANDRSRSSLLVERCEPGTQLWAVPDDEEATRIAAGVLQRLWRAPAERHPFRLLETEAAAWERQIPADWEQLGGPFERELMDAAVDALVDLARSQGDRVVLHQDFHGGNVLRAEREPWLAIDPKPLVGEREFDAASLLRDRRSEISHRRVERRLDLLETCLGLDRERLRGWGIAHALAWGISPSKLEPEMVEAARALLSV